VPSPVEHAAVTNQIQTILYRIPNKMCGRKLLISLKKKKKEKIPKISTKAMAWVIQCYPHTQVDAPGPHTQAKKSR
jgi:hypothetical protein